MSLQQTATTDGLQVENLIASINEELKKLPATEINYYVALLLAAIKNESQPEACIDLLVRMQVLIEELKKFYANPKDTEENLISLKKALNDLIAASEMESISHKIKRAVLSVVGAVAAVVMGAIFGLAGLAIGLFTDWNIIGNIKGAGLGLLSGFAIGGLVGTRGTTKLFQNEFDTKVEFCMDNFARLRDEVKDRRPETDYQAETKQYILDTFFKDVPEEEREQKFQEFLQSEQEFQICTTTAGHISPTLKGSMGHHSLIRFKINGVKDIPIEFGDRAKTPNFVDQSEKPRKVSGQKLFEMLVLDRKLQDTHESGLKSLRIYDIGSDDCRTYVDKILIGTGQEPTKIGRFSDNDTNIGRKIVRPLITFFNKTRGDELVTLLDNPDDTKFDVAQHVYDAKGPKVVF